MVRQIREISRSSPNTLRGIEMFLPYSDSIQAGVFLTTSAYPFVNVPISQSNLIETVYLIGRVLDTTTYVTGVMDQKEQKPYGGS